MTKFKLSALFIAAALGVAAVGSAALTNLSFGRSVAGQVLVDTDPNAAVQITNTSDYQGLVKTDADGKVSLNLNAAIGGNENSGFNTDAQFTIGSPTEGVIKIKNNSDITVDVSLTDDSNAITLTPVSNSVAAIGAGASSDFYFTVDTRNAASLKALNAVLHVEGE